MGLFSGKQSGLNPLRCQHNQLSCEISTRIVQERDISILVETVEKRNSIRHTLSNISIETQTADSLVAENANEIVVESISHFKGLESKVVILYNPPYEDDSGINGCTIELLYTAVSRCFCYLIITTQAGCRALWSDQRIQEITGNTAQQGPWQFPTRSPWDRNSTLFFTTDTNFPYRCYLQYLRGFDEMTPYPMYDQAKNISSHSNSQWTLIQSDSLNVANLSCHTTFLVWR